MADDILDVVGDPKRTGKSAGTDWEQRKMTLPLIMLREDCESSDLESFRSMFDDSADRRGELVDWLRATSAIERSQAKADEFASLASAELGRMPAGPCRDRLEEISRFAAYRAS
jgi:octaprenyl-diphosphate synthase